jgi:hypothetical protein
MYEWMVRLEGSAADLQEFPYMFRSDRLNVRKEGGDYYLRSSEFDALSDVDEVRARALELIPLMTGIVKLRAGYAEAVTADVVVKVNDDGTTQRFVLLAGSLRARATLRMLQDTPASELTEAERWMTLALQGDEKVVDALRFFEEPTTWWSLRKAYEVVETELKQPSKIDKLGWASLDDIKRFKEWAGHYVHGEQSSPPDANRYPQLPLVEAEAFIQMLLTRWLRWKLGE